MTSSLELYWISGSPFAWRVQLLLHLKGLDYQSHRLDPGQQDQKQPAYLALNPRGKVPLLKEGDVVVRESMAIVAYLSAQHPDWHLFGHTPQDLGLVWQQVLEVDNFISAKLAPLVFPIFFGSVAGKETEIQEAAQAIAAEFAVLDQTLTPGNWLVGSHLTAADVAAYPVVKFLERAMHHEAVAHLDLGFLPFAEKFPHLSAWADRLAALPGVLDSTPPHWR
ncbi:glutathione S-transferase family protein [Prochlorothrix hollandica]|uniref:glutathione S-transferase family protein n=1 Tax=Prochlorothrix hollandica TaxID=1223 RepID=UPI003340BE0F